MSNGRRQRDYDEQQELLALDAAYQRKRDRFDVLTDADIAAKQECQAQLDEQEVQIPHRDCTHLRKLLAIILEKRS